MRIFFIINPKRRSRAPADSLIEQFHEELKACNCDYRLELSESIEHSRDLVDEAKREGYNSLWIGGGDGTINQLLNHSIGKGFSYGIVPMGTINALARSLGIPTDPVEAVRYLAKSNPEQMDLVEVNGHYFLCYASVGVHAAVMHGVSTELKKRYGKLAFFVSGAKAALHKSSVARFVIEFRPIDADNSECTLSRRPLENEEIENGWVRKTGYSLILSNICNYVGFGIVREESCSSMYQELHLFRRRRLLPMFRWFIDWRFDDGAISPKWGVDHYKVSECRLTSEQPMFVQIDGEPIEVDDPKNLHFRCHARAVQVLLQPREAVVSGIAADVTRRATAA
jgi:diacylglycerol kinase family enzyme